MRGGARGGGGAPVRVPLAPDPLPARNVLRLHTHRYTSLTVHVRRPRRQRAEAEAAALLGPTSSGLSHKQIMFPNSLLFLGWQGISSSNATRSGHPERVALFAEGSVRLLLTKNPTRSFSYPSCQIRGLWFEWFPRPFHPRLDPIPGSTRAWS